MTTPERVTPELAWPELDQWRVKRARGGARFDRLLSQGWECTGPIMHRGPLASLGSAPLGLVPIRQPLSADALSRNQRKLLARNRRRFAITVSDRCDLDAAEALYAGARPRFIGPSFESLGDLAGCYLPPGGPEIFEVAVRDGARLVAVSYLLVGQRAGYSLIGLFDPDYARHSLGTQTLLEEVDFLRARSAALYYPGHVMLGNDALHYKLRLRGLEYLHWRRGWLPIAGFDPTDHPVAALERRLTAAQTALLAGGLPAVRTAYGLFFLPQLVSSLPHLLGAPEYLDLGPLPDGGRLAAVPRLASVSDQLVRLRPAEREPWHDNLNELLGAPLVAVPFGAPLRDHAALVNRARGLLAG